jgi:pyrroline-5-carboxylate reductase
MISETRVGFIGAGRMATALAQGMLAADVIASDRLCASDVSPEARNGFTVATGAAVWESNRQVIDTARMIVLAVKPQMLPAVLEEIAPVLTPEHMVISIVAGVTLERLESALPQRRLVRVMPNTPCLVGAGAAGFSAGRFATDADRELVREMFTTVGLAVDLPEHLLDAVTGLSGSGPAYAFEMIEALSDGGVLMGLPRSTATLLAAQTLCGAAKMVLETGEHPAQLKDAVTSPGGTTIAGLHELERGGLRGVLMDAVRAATERSQELGSS